MNFGLTGTDNAPQFSHLKKNKKVLETFHELNEKKSPGSCTPWVSPEVHSPY